jgi:MFS transporter, AAHS family, benzoate transport protein
MPENSRETARRRTLAWVVALSTAALIFDGYDLVVYGTVVPTLLADASHLGAISPEQAGTLGSELPRTRDRVRAGGA